MAAKKAVFFLLSKIDLSDDKLVSSVLICARSHHSSCHFLSKLLREHFPAAFDFEPEESSESYVRSLLTASRSRNLMLTATRDRSEDSVCVLPLGERRSPR